jgi:hypothetical protein
LDRESIEAVGLGKPRKRKPTLSWKLAVERFRRGFGAVPDPAAKGGVDKDREAAIAKRRQRARETRLSDVMLSKKAMSDDVQTPDDEE